MRTIAIALSALLVTSVVSAQPAPYQHDQSNAWDSNAFWRGAPDNPRERIQFLQDRISRGRSDGSLDHREADRAQGELDHVRGWIREMHYDNGGPLGPDQRAHIQERLDQISRQIRWMRHDGW